MSRSKVLGLFALSVVMAFASTAFAQNTKVVESGETTVALSSGFLSALQSLGITPGVVAPTQLNGTTVNFPINGGAIDLVSNFGNIGHSGGLTLSNGSTVVGIQNFTIDTTGSSPVITGLVLVNGAVAGRITLFDLSIPRPDLPIRLYNKVLINLPLVGVTLDGAAAQALNSVFHTNAFHSGIGIGTADVLAFTNGWIPQ